MTIRKNSQSYKLGLFYVSDAVDVLAAQASRFRTLGAKRHATRCREAASKLAVIYLEYRHLVEKPTKVQP